MKTIMEKVISYKSASQNTFRMGAPLIPREHGAWVILYAPLLIGLAAAWPSPALSVVLLFIAVTGVYLARHAGSLLLRKSVHHVQANTRWLVIYLAIAAAGGLPLLIIYDHFELLALAGLVTVIYLLHLVIEKLPMRSRLLRAQWSELVGMTALTLTAPAAYITAGGQLDGMALCLWSGCALFFGSGVFHVRMLIFAAKEKKPLDASDRWRLGRGNLLYHTLLLVAVFFSASHLPLRSAILLWMGYLPVVVRAVDGTIMLSNVPPSFKKSGWFETGYALWFAVCFIGALHG